MSAGVISAFRAPSSLRSDGEAEAEGDDAEGEVVCAATPRSATVDEASASGEALLSEPEQAAVANSVPAARAAARTRAGRTSGRGVVTCASCGTDGTDGPPGADLHRARLLPRLPPHHRSARATSAAEAYR
ncbi:hypothetical protein STENM223S_06386 [Streptomyces tendae]